MSQLPITKVTLLEDRAYVTRAGKLDLEAGVHRLEIEAVTPLAVDKTLSATVEGASCQVIDARLRRWRPKLEPVPPKPVENEELQEQLQMVEQQLTQSKEVYSQFLDQLMLAVAHHQTPTENWPARLQELEQWQDDLLAEQGRLRTELSELARAGQPAPAAPPPPQARIELELRVEQAGAYRVSLEYCVPGACWRPYHQASLAGPTLTFRCDGCVWQNTGEDWPEVELWFSTQRPTQGVDPPELGVDYLASQRKQTEVVVAERDQEVQALEPEGGLRPQLGPPELPGIDDGGEVVKLKALSLTSVPSDGQPVRTSLFEFKVETSVERVLTAELACEVIEKTMAVNTSSHPVLAGPVDLIREGGLVGRGQVLYLAPNEKFQLSWGPDPALRVQRTAKKSEESKADLTGGWRKTEHTITLKLSNLGLEPRHLTVIERVPVSEIKQVEISCQKNEPDADGLVRWQVELGPRGRRELELTYEVRRRKEVVGL
ncbi:MAG: mucoidy inhibitor MuiA family protein [Vulcanimicrobiota bacterium]